ncbi:TRAP transporter small permease [Georgenia sp. Z1491]|uniref:TRAP transporter small permease n=1 Tax=Georgenia sp. Z1491 TaxID=3416707 RepID=UPI003CF59D6E
MDSDAPTPPGRGPTRREALVRRTSHGLAAIAGGLLLVLFVVNVVQIGARPFMGGWIWVNDLSRLLITWVIMIGASAAVGLREHLVVDFVVDRVPAAFRTACAYLTRVIELAIGVVLLVSGTIVALDRMSIQYIQLGIPTGWAYLAVPVLGLFLVLFGVLRGVRGPEGPALATADAGAAS